MDYYEQNGRFFIKFFIIDGTVSANRWGATAQSVYKNLHTFAGKPFIMMYKDGSFGHPHPENPDDMFEVQKKFQVGTITEVGIDQGKDRAWGVAEITDPEARKLIQSGQVKFVSPSILYNMADMHYDGQNQKIITDFEAAHVAGVKDPAFGMYKAAIKGQCTGDPVTCKNHLMMVQASVDGSWKYEKKSCCGIVSANNSIKSTSSTKKMTMTEQATIEELSGKLEELSKKFETVSAKSVEQEKTIKTLTEAAEKKKKDPKDPFENDSDEAKLLKANAKKIEELQAKLELQNKTPLINKIVEAKIQLGHITPEGQTAEVENLQKVDASMLNTIAAEYANLTKNIPSGMSVRFPAERQGASASKETIKTSNNVILAMAGEVA